MDLEPRPEGLGHAGLEPRCLADADPRRDQRPGACLVGREECDRPKARVALRQAPNDGVALEDRREACSVLIEGEDPRHLAPDSV